MEDHWFTCECYGCEPERKFGPQVVEEKKEDVVNHPQHYTFGSIEVIDAIEDWQLDYHLGNVVKYVARAKYKGNFVENLSKAKWYLERRITKEEESGK